MIRLLIGSLIALVALYFSVIMTGASPLLYLHPPELLAVVGIPVGLGISSFGAERFLKTIPGIFGVRASVAADRIVLKRWILATYAVGGLSFIAGFVLVFAILDQGAMVIGHKFAAALCAPFYAVIVSEFLLRPALSRIVDSIEA